jgi:hypothetical protein
LIEAWQAYSWDKRTSSGPALEQHRVSFVVSDPIFSRLDVRQYEELVDACADFIYREAFAVLVDSSPPRAQK